MRLDKITSSINTEAIATRAKEIVAPLNKKVLDTPTMPKVSAARLNLELHAEDLTPQEYISARAYISALEWEDFIASEMKSLK